MNLWHDLDPGPSVPDVIHVIVEIPKGSRNKYEYHKQTGAFKLDRVLNSPVHYPGDYGFIPQTYYEDGDPLDVLVVTNLPTFTGCIVEARPIGMFRMRDKGEADTTTDPTPPGATAPGSQISVEIAAAILERAAGLSSAFMADRAIPRATTTTSAALPF